MRGHLGHKTLVKKSLKKNRSLVESSLLLPNLVALAFWYPYIFSIPLMTNVFPYQNVYLCLQL